MTKRLDSLGDQHERHGREGAARDPIPDALLRSSKPLLNGNSAAESVNHFADGREVRHTSLIKTVRCVRQYPNALLGDPGAFWHIPHMDIETREADSQTAIGERLRMLRTALDLSQAEAADRFGVESQQAWGNYERGERPLDYRIALTIAQKEGASLDWIYRGLRGTLNVTLAEKLTAAKPAKRGRPRKTA